MATKLFPAVVVGPTYIYLFDPKEMGIGLTRIDLSQSSGFGNSITAAYADPITDQLFYIFGGNSLASWNTGGTKLTYTWRSKVYQFSYGTVLQAGQTKGDSYGTGVTLNVYGDGNLFHTATLTSETEFVLTIPTAPTFRKEFEVEFVGTANLKVVEIANDMEELS
jgi:hypothetical protein